MAASTLLTVVNGIKGIRRQVQARQAELVAAGVEERLASVQALKEELGIEDGLRSLGRNIWSLLRFCMAIFLIWAVVMMILINWHHFTERP